MLAAVCVPWNDPSACAAAPPVWPTAGLIRSFSFPGVAIWRKCDSVADEVGAEIARALDHLDVPEREKQEGLAASSLGRTRWSILSGTKRGPSGWPALRSG